MPIGIFHLAGLNLAALALSAICCLSTAHAAGQEQEPKATPAHNLPCEEAKAGGPEEVVRKLYTETPFDVDRRPIKDSEKRVKKFFDERLGGLLAKFMKCDLMSDNCPGMPADIFVNDNQVTWQFSDLRICAMDAKSGMVQVEYRNFDTPESVAYMLAKGRTGWRITDIYFVGKVRPFDPEKADAFSMLGYLSGYFERHK